MMEIPSSPWRSTPPGDASEAPLRASWKKGAGRIEHGFTHFHLVLDIWRSLEIETGEVLADGDYRWVRPEHLGREALPSLMRKIVAAMM
jgi:A/G-specific adenine glycosylase